MKFAALGSVLVVALLAGCAPQVRPNQDYSLQREAIAGSHKPVPVPLDVGNGKQAEPLAGNPAPEAHYGTGVFIQPAARGSSGGATNQQGTITFNFDNQPVQAAVKAILGDVLHVNYSIAPSVKGSITFATSQPVSKDEVLPILQMLLSWTGNALVRQGGGYMVVPVDQAAPGNLVPGLGAVSPGAGYAAQLFPLHYVSAEAMQKLLKPFADPKAFLLVDPVRNLLVMGGTPDELANYQRIIRTFDVDWLRGMSVAVIPLQHVQATDLVSQLGALFSEQAGEKGEKMSSLIRLIPLKQSNSLVVITPQPSYLDEVRKLVTTIDNGAGNSSGLYVYNVLNVKASALARHLNELFGNNAGNGQQNSAGAVAPGFSPLEQAAPGSLGAQQGFGSFAANGSFGSGAGQTGGDEFGGGGGVGAGMVEGATQTRRQQQSGQGTVAFTTSEGVRIAAVNENNQLLIRATPGQWEKLLPVIERLDEKPLQVQIETKVLEVTLSGEFQFGVQYFLSHIESGAQLPPSAIPIPPIPTPQPYGLFYTFAGKNLALAVSALDSSGDVKLLSAPSTVVLNNQETTFKVGEKIPVVQTYLAPGLGVGSTAGVNVGQVQYIDTGVLLDVVPRVSPGGLVYMDVQQIVSKPTSQDKFGNYTIANRALSTEVAVQSGQTVLLGGLIQQSDSDVNAGIPFLDRIPVVGHLFGNTDRNKTRTELIVLITPRIIRNPEDARRVTDEYQTQFESLRPILPTSAPAPVAAPVSGAPVSVPLPASSYPAPTVSGSTGNRPAAAAQSGGWVVRVASFTRSQDSESLSRRLQQLGYTSYVASTPTPAGMRWQVYAGPVVNRDTAERLRDAIIDSLHIGGMLIERF